jgi:hypothetical protein
MMSTWINAKAFRYSEIKEFEPQYLHNFPSTGNDKFKIWDKVKLIKKSKI